jgi:two-component system LytT family response regulator
MTEIDCIIIDDEKGSRERMAIILGKMDYVKIIGIEEDPITAIELIINKKPNLVFVDVEMPRMSGFDVVKEVRKSLPEQNFIFVTAYNQYSIKAIKNEAFDFLLKPVDIDELKETLNRYLKKQFLNPKKSSCLNTELLMCLTEREIELLTLIGQYKTAIQIAKELNLSKYTVDTHRKNILKKTKLNKISELVVFARENGLV